MGKSTLCRHLFPEFGYSNLEDFETLLKAQTEPKAFLQSMGSKVIIDEVQRCETLFSQIQAEVDTDPQKNYILTGSSDFLLMKNVSQSLAGRVAIFTLPPLTFEELDRSQKDLPIEELYCRGFYPGVGANHRPADIFYRNYYSTYIEKDIRRLVKVENLVKFDVFMRLTAARMGSEFNASSMAAEVGVSSKTINDWISILEASYIIFTLRPYHFNIPKRYTKMPKIYFYDTGLVTYLLGIESAAQLIAHPLKGALFENMAVAELINRRLNLAKDLNYYFYRESGGREVDVLQVNPDGIKAYEIKSAKAFHLEFLKNLDYLRLLLPDKVKESTVVYDGDDFLPLAVNIRNL